MLNRKALIARAQELTQQSEVTGEPVGMIAGFGHSASAANHREPRRHDRRSPVVARAATHGPPLLGGTSV